jgi:6-phosphogluconate dehydrogenase
MKIGMVGLGRMGAGLAARLKGAGHEVVGYDQNPEIADVDSLESLIASLEPPRIVWIMVPDGAPTEQTVSEVAALLSPDDIVIEGGNSFYKDSIRRAEEVSKLGLHYLDAGTSGGIWGLEVGFCLMIGGPREAFETVEPIFKALAPVDGYMHMGPSGAGHFTKMVHNGIEYGMMQAFAEGFELLKAYDEPIDLHQTAALWNHGSVVRSWLLELAERAFENDPDLDELRGYVDDSGEGRWTVQEAVDRGVPASVITQALFARFSSRDDNAFGMRVLAALRNEFGGHAVRKS